jgi:cholesterol transport system auxiliary component
VSLSPNLRFVSNICALFAVCSTVAGCALTSKADALSFRYFEPMVPAPQGQVAPGGPRGELRLGRISAASHLRERRVVRKDDSEVAFDDERRWTERPDAYLRRALAHALYEEQGMKQSVSGQSPVLDCELLHFEEVQEGGRTQKVRVGMVYALHDERSVLVGETFVVVVPIEGQGESGIVRAYEKALRQLVDRAVSKVTPAAQKPSP